MKQYILMFEYNSKEFMNIDKIIIFKENINKIEKTGKKVNIVFYGDDSAEELSTFMSYFNCLMQKNICNITISLQKREIIVENGINNKSIKLSAKKTKEIKCKKFDNVINEYYSNTDEKEIKLLPNRKWESIVLDLMEE